MLVSNLEEYSMNKLDNKVVMVWGGSGGTGFPMAQVFLEAGAKVVIIGRDLGKLTAAQARLGFENTLAVQADASSKEGVLKAFDETETAFGTPDLVVAIVGGAKDWERNFPDTDPEELAASLERLRAAFVLPLQNILEVSEKHFSEKGWGWLIHLSSHVVQKDETVLPGNKTYRDSKTEADNMVLRLASQHNGTKIGWAQIRFTNLRPAIILTGANTELLDTLEKRSGAVRPETMAHWVIENFENPNVPGAQLFDSDIVV